MDIPTVRRARPGEYDAVADLTARIYLGEGYGDELYEPALRDVAGRDTAGEVLVAVLEDHLVGAVTVVTGGGEWAEQASRDEAVIRMLAVAPEARGSGAGAGLVQACLERARAAGCLRVRLSTQPDMAAAHRLYGRFGFVRAPSYDWVPTPGVELLGYVLELT